MRMEMGKEQEDSNKQANKTDGEGEELNKTLISFQIVLRLIRI